jgi:hypothetical protein
MFSNYPVFRCGAAGVVALLALVYAGGAAAGMFTTANSLADFNIDWSEDRVIYASPSLDQVALEIRETDNKVVLTSVDAAPVQTWTDGGGWHGQVTLAAAGGQGTGDGSYLAFGALQEFGTTGEGVEMTLDAMESAGGDATGVAGYPSWLGFLLTGPSTGAYANDLRAYGVYVHVAGLTEEYWARLLESGSVTNLLEAPGARLASAEYGAEMPTPATPLLLLAGVVGWRMMRRRT